MEAVRHGVIGTIAVMVIFGIIALFAPDLAADWGPKAVAISIAHVIALVGLRWVVAVVRARD